MNITRRELIKNSAIVATAVATGSSLVDIMGRGGGQCVTLTCSDYSALAYIEFNPQHTNTGDSGMCILYGSRNNKMLTFNEWVGSRG